MQYKGQFEYIVLQKPCVVFVMLVIFKYMKHQTLMP